MTAVQHRLTAIPLLLLTGALLGGCGGTGGNTRTSASSASTEHPTPTQRTRARTNSAQAKAQALAFAHAVNLRASDVPGFAVSPEPQRHRETPTERRLAQELSKCVGTSRQAAGLVQASSGEFERKGGLANQSVSSHVTVESSAALASGDLSTIRSRRLRSCLSRYFSGLLSGLATRGASVSGVSTKYGSPPAPGATGSFGLRVTAKLTYHSFQIPIYLDYLAFASGSAEVALRSMGTPVPFPASAEEQLFTLLLERAKAHRA
jgi:hypothetical protein